MTMIGPRGVAYPIVIRNHHLDRCLHIFTMAKILERDTKIPVNFTFGNVITLGPTPAPKAPASYKYVLDLYNERGDILLQIWCSTECIHVRDRARRSLGDGWGNHMT